MNLHSGRSPRPSSLEGLIELSKVVILIVYYRKEYGLKSVKIKGTWDGVRERPGTSFGCPSCRVVRTVLNSPSNDMCDALPTREAYLSLSVQASHWGLATVSGP